MEPNRVEPLPPCEAPTLYFVGVSTAASSIMRVFPKWAEVLELDARLRGYDAPLHAPPEVYARIVRHLKEDPLARGALVTTHKLDLLAATRDLFDALDPYAERCGEVSCISKRGGNLVGHAKDPISSRLALDAFVPPEHWRRTQARVLCFGAGGAALAISLALADSDRPAYFTAVDVNPGRLKHLRRVHRDAAVDLPCQYLLNGDPEQNDALVRALPAGSLIINATGMGKDRPGSPITDGSEFPEGGLVWELNYRGELTFLEQAKRQARAARLHLEDGWVYFLHGWTQVVAEVFGLTLTPELFAELRRVAAEA